jgi:hypothetical protein
MNGVKTKDGTKNVNEIIATGGSTNSMKPNAVAKTLMRNKGSETDRARKRRRQIHLLQRGRSKTHEPT